MNAILFVLRSGAQWNSLDATGICSCSSAYRCFRDWTQAGVFANFWKQGLWVYDRAQDIDWSWLAIECAMSKGPLSGAEKWVLIRPTGVKGCEAQPFDRSQGNPDRCGHRRRQP